MYIACLQLGRIYLDMVNVYKVLSENISSAVSVSGKLFCVCVFVCAVCGQPLPRIVAVCL